MLSLEQQNELRERYRRQNPSWRPATEIFADLVRNHLHPDSLVLDLGCGRGGLVEQLGHPLKQIVGIDPDLISLREHRLANRLPTIGRVVGLSQNLPFADERFDLILASWVLEHLAKPTVDFGQISRVLRASGFFIFITPNKRHPLATINRIMGRFGTLQDLIVKRIYDRAPADTFSTFYRANTAVEIQRLAQTTGMQLVELHPIADPTYLAFRPSWLSLAGALEEKLPAERHIHFVGILRREAG